MAKAMRWKRVLGALAVLALLVIAYAWIDGGRETVRPIEYQIPVPGAGK